MSAYEEGRVYRATVRGVSNTLFIARTDDWFSHQIGTACWVGTSFEDVTDVVGPLVVLDLEDPVHVVKALRSVLSPWDCISDLADVIEAQTKPPRMAQPSWGERVIASTPTSQRRVWLHDDVHWHYEGSLLGWPWDSLIDPEPYTPEAAAALL